MTRRFHTTLVTHGAHYTVEVAENELSDQRSVTLSRDGVVLSHYAEPLHAAISWEGRP